MPSEPYYLVIDGLIAAGDEEDAAAKTQAIIDILEQDVGFLVDEAKVGVIARKDVTPETLQELGVIA